MLSITLSSHKSELVRNNLELSVNYTVLIKGAMTESTRKLEQYAGSISLVEVLATLSREIVVVQ